MLEPCCEYLFARCIWLYALIMPRTCFRVSPYSRLNIEELLGWNRSKIWSLRDCNWTRTYNHLVRKQTLNYVTKLLIWLVWLNGYMASLANWPVWLNGWVFVYELSGCGFESSCSHLNFKFRTCFEQGVPWH